MKPLARSLAIVAVLLPVVAHAETLPILERTIEFEPPETYCLIDRSDPYETQIFDYMAGVQREHGVELLAFYAVCDEIAAIVEGRAGGFQHYGMLVALPGSEGVVAPLPGYTRPKLFDALEASLPSARDEIAEGAEQVRQQFADLGIALSDFTQPTIVGVDDNALYAAFSLQADAGSGPVPVAAVSGFTYVEELTLVNHLYAPGTEPTAFEDLYVLQSALMEDFVAANE